MHALARFAALLTLLAVVSPRMFSQTETGSISGTVTDPSGAVVTNATVTAKNTATGAVRTASTSSAGTYLISNLPPGPMFNEAFRVLKPGGRFAVSDVVVRGEVPAEIKKSVELWARLRCRRPERLRIRREGGQSRV